MTETDPFADPAFAESGGDIAVQQWAVRHAAAERAMFGEGLAAAWAAGDMLSAQSLSARLAAIPEVSPVEALRASHRLTQLLMAARGSEIRVCREAGDSWTAIAEAIGTTGSAAREFYRNRDSISVAVGRPHLRRRPCCRRPDERHSE